MHLHIYTCTHTQAIRRFEQQEELNQPLTVCARRKDESSSIIQDLCRKRCMYVCTNSDDGFVVALSYFYNIRFVVYIIYGFQTNYICFSKIILSSSL